MCMCMCVYIYIYICICFSFCFVTELCLLNFSGLGVRVVWKLFISAGTMREPTAARSEHPTQQHGAANHQREAASRHVLGH